MYVLCVLCRHCDCGNANLYFRQKYLYLSFRRKNGGRQVTEKPFTSKWKKEMYGWLNVSLKSTETRDELSTSCMSRCLSAPDATSLHYCLKNK